jgi:mRNA interferase MazF
MARHTYYPDRGDLVHVNFQPSAGREQTGPRYAIVLSPRSYNRAAGLTVCCPITSQVKGYPFEIPVAGNIVKGVVLSDHVRSIDWRERGMQFAEKAPESVVQSVAEHVAVLIGVDRTG